MLLSVMNTLLSKPSRIVIYGSLAVQPVWCYFDAFIIVYHGNKLVGLADYWKAAGSTQHAGRYCEIAAHSCS